VQLLLDPYVLLRLCLIQPLFEAVDILCVFTKQNDNFICDFIADLKVCEGQLYSLYVDNETCFGRDEFWAF
jgi:hypothetical protein